MINVEDIRKAMKERGVDGINPFRLGHFVQALLRAYDWQKSIADERARTLRKFHALANAYASHDWQDAKPSPSGKRGARCSLCGRYSNAPVLSCLDPCTARLEAWERDMEATDG